MTLLNIVWAAFGLIFSILIDLLKIKQKVKNNEIEFRFGYWWAENRLVLLVSLLAILPLLYFAHPICEAMLQIEVPKEAIFYDFFALCAGYSNHTLLNDVIKSFTKTK